MSRQEAIAPSWRERLRAAGLADPAALLEHSLDTAALSGHCEELTKAGLGGRERWRWKLNADADGEVVYVKRYRHTLWRAQLDRILRQSPAHSRAWWEFHQSQRLGAARICVPEPVAFVEEMRGVFERRSAVVLGRVAGDGFDREWQRACREDAPVTRSAARHDIAGRLGRFIAAFHQTGFCHRDLYLCHVFVELDKTGEQPPAFTLIDLARTHRPRWRRMRWIVKDLAQLDSSARQIGARRTDRVRFLLAYLGLQRGEARTRQYARRIRRKSDWILRRIERKIGAP